MGLTGTLLYSWYWGLRLVLMSPQEFLARPASWLWAVSRFRVTGCAAPNFAYSICSNPSKVRDDALQGLDLSCWRVAFTGAELVQEKTIRTFTARYAPTGSARKRCTPCTASQRASSLLVSQSTVVFRCSITSIATRWSGVLLRLLKLQTARGGSSRWVSRLTVGGFALYETARSLEIGR